MIKAIITTLTLVTGFATQATVEDMSTPSAKQQLQQLLSNLNTYDATFTQEVVDRNNEVLQSSQGRLTMRQPNQLIWHVIGEDESKLVADGSTIWHEDSFSEQVIAMTQAATANNNPFLLLAEPDSKHWDEYQVLYQQGSFTVSSSDPRAMIQSLVLRFNGETLTSFDFIDNQQQRSAIVFSEIQQGISLSDTVFDYQLPVDYDLDDQR